MTPNSQTISTHSKYSAIFAHETRSSGLQVRIKNPSIEMLQSYESVQVVRDELYTFCTHYTSPLVYDSVRKEGLERDLKIYPTDNIIQSCYMYSSTSTGNVDSLIFSYTGPVLRSMAIISSLISVSKSVLFVILHTRQLR